MDFFGGDLAGNNAVDGDVKIFSIKAGRDRRIAGGSDADLFDGGLVEGLEDMGGFAVFEGAGGVEVLVFEPKRAGF